MEEKFHFLIVFHKPLEHTCVPRKSHRCQFLPWTHGYKGPCNRYRLV